MAYLISSKARERGWKGRTIPLFLIPLALSLLPPLVDDDKLVAPSILLSACIVIVEKLWSNTAYQGFKTETCMGTELNDLPEYLFPLDNSSMNSPVPLPFLSAMLSLDSTAWGFPKAATLTQNSDQRYKTEYKEHMGDDTYDQGIVERK